MALKRILAATDFSSRSERALQRAGLLCRNFAAELRLVHVADDDQPAELLEGAVTKATAALERAASTLRAAVGVNAKTVMRTGAAFEAIVQSAAENDADLIVMGSHRKRFLHDVFVGTTIERVIRTGSRPVLMVNTEPNNLYRRVLAAIDTSEASGNALRSAAALGLLDGAQLSLVHAFEPFAKAMLIYANIEREKVEAYAARQAARAHHNISSFLAKLDLGKIAYDIELEEGPTLRVITAAIEKERPDLLVIGTRGLTGVKRILLGSVADALMRRAECDVLAVPPR